MQNDLIKIVEVGPRDGLQNETNIIDTGLKVDFINRLTDSGLQHIEVSSFVNPNAIPQLYDAEEVFKKIDRKKNINYGSLVPNERGMQRALSVNPSSVAVFTAASETFCQKNINCSIAESMDRFKPVLALAEKDDLPVRAYVSCVLGCPYEGFIDPDKVVDLTLELINMGCYEVSLGDTIGAGTPWHAVKLMQALAEKLNMDKIAIHFHDTRGQALANILACLDFGVKTIDTSVAGLGGCPYADGATGNVATEDVVYMLHGLGHQTGVNLDELIQVGRFISDSLNRKNQSKVGTAGVPHEYASYQTT